MKILLASALSLNGEIDKNFEIMKKIIEDRKKSNQTFDMILFGEAFLHGFDGINFNYKEDIKKSISMKSVEIANIRKLAKDNSVAIGFGFYENEKGGIYSTYLVIDDNGEILTKYQRKSTGWKIKSACADYREGSTFKTFIYKDKKFGVMLCGDFWEDYLLPEIIDMDSEVDVFLWPVHIDFTKEEWNKNEKEDYRKRTEILAKPVLFVDNFHFDTKIARACLFKQGEILKELNNNSYICLTRKR